MITTGTIYVIQARTTITGPNDAIRVVWALGEYFIKIYSCFTNILIIFNRLFNKFQDEGTQTTWMRLEPRYYYPPPPLPPPTPFRTRHRITTHTYATTTPKSPTGPEQRFLPLFMPNKYFFRIYIYRFRYIYRHRYIYR